MKKKNILKKTGLWAVTKISSCLPGKIQQAEENQTGIGEI